MRKICYHHVIFDFDGTLFDTKQGIITSFKMMLSDLGYPYKEEYARYIGMDLDSLLTTIGFPDTQIQEGADLYRHHYKTYGINSGPFTGTKELIEKIHSAGGKLYILSHKPEPIISRLLEKYGLLHYFEKIIGTSDEKTNAIKQFPLEDAIMIGDYPGDIKAGNAVGIDTIACLYGFGHRDEMLALDPTYRVESINQIENIIFEK